MSLERPVILIGRNKLKRRASSEHNEADHEREKPAPNQPTPAHELFVVSPLRLSSTPDPILSLPLGLIFDLPS